MHVVQPVRIEEINPLTRRPRYRPSPKMIRGPFEIAVGESVEYVDESRFFGFIRWRDRLYRISLDHLRRHLEAQPASQPAVEI